MKTTSKQVKYVPTTPVKKCYAVQAVTEKDGLHYCTQIKKGLFFFIKGKNLPAPTLFPTRKSAQ